MFWMLDFKFFLFYFGESYIDIPYREIFCFVFYLLNKLKYCIVLYCIVLYRTVYIYQFSLTASEDDVRVLVCMCTKRVLNSTFLQLIEICIRKNLTEIGRCS